MGVQHAFQYMQPLAKACILDIAKFFWTLPLAAKARKYFRFRRIKGYRYRDPQNNQLFSLQ